MTNLNSLPYEIQKLILQHIDSTKQLSECRRVSKMWDSPAECAMFSRKLHITEHNSTSLYMHLSRKPSLANLIKEIYLDTESFTDTMALLLRLATTSSIMKITSDDYPDIRFYQTLAQIAKDSGMKLQHLKSIPWPATYSFTEIHYQAILLLKNSLEEIKILPSPGVRPHKISNHLEEFKCLSTLHVDWCIFQNLPQAESIFRGARKLKKIDLSNCYLGQGNNWSSEERLHWMKQHVEINETAVALKAIDHTNLSISLVEYLLYKYPNTRQFDCQARWFNDVNSHVEINTQACLRISKIPRYTLTLTRDHQWKSHYRSFAGYKNAFRLANHGELPVFDDTTMISSKIEQDQKRNTQFRFRVDNIFSGEFFDGVHVAFLEDIGAFTTSLYIDFKSFDTMLAGIGVHRRGTFESNVFFEALKVMNHLEDMQFISIGKLEAVELDLPSQHEKRQLKTLEINVREIQPAAFHTLDRLFHTINTLKFPADCYIKKDQTNTICIHMPSTALEKLSITTKLKVSRCSFYYRYRKMLLPHCTFIMLNLQQGVTLYFKLEPFNSNVHQISFFDYFSRPPYSSAFSIDSRMIANVEFLNLGVICANIDVQNYCKTLDAEFE